jgi:hypothetical protein
MAKKKSTFSFGSTSGGAGAGIGIGTSKPPTDIYAPIPKPVKPPEPIGGVTPGGGVGPGSAGSTFTNKPAGGAGAKVSLIPGLGGVGPKSDLGYMAKQMEHVKQLAEQKAAIAKDKTLKANEGKGFAPSEATDEELKKQQAAFKPERKEAINDLRGDIREEAGASRYLPGSFADKIITKKKATPSLSTIIKGFSVNKKKGTSKLIT